MSKWAYLRVDTGGPDPATVAEAPIGLGGVSAGALSRAVGVERLSEFNGGSGFVLGAVFAHVGPAAIQRALAEMQAERPTLVMGEDDVRAACEWIAWLTDAARKHPKATFAFSE